MHKEAVIRDVHVSLTLYVCAYINIIINPNVPIYSKKILSIRYRRDCQFL